MVLVTRFDNNAYGGLGPLLLGISWTECLTAVLLIMFRAYGASVGAGKLRTDFVIVVIATIFGLITQVLFVLACVNGMGDRVVNLTLDQLWATLKYSWTGVIVGILGVTIAKLAIITLILQVTTPEQIKRKIFLYAVGAIIVLASAAQVAITLSQCEPYDRLWYRMKQGNCDRSHFAAQFGYFHGAVSAASDFTLALYPITIVWNLRASWRVKCGFCILMAGGVLPAAAAMIRTYYIRRLESPSDFTWEFVPFLSWACTELWFVIILGCVPPLRPLFKRWFGKLTGHTALGSGVSSFGHSAGGSRGGGVNCYYYGAGGARGEKYGTCREALMSAHEKGRDHVLEPAYFRVEKGAREVIVVSKECSQGRMDV